VQPTAIIQISYDLRTKKLNHTTHSPYMDAKPRKKIAPHTLGRDSAGKQMKIYTMRERDG